MLQDSLAFSGFSVNDLEAARTFYADTLGLTVEDGGPGFSLKLAGGKDVLVYLSPNHRAASYTILTVPPGPLFETNRFSKSYVYVSPDELVVFPLAS